MVSIVVHVESQHGGCWTYLGKHRLGYNEALWTLKVILIAMSVTHAAAVRQGRAVPLWLFVVASQGPPQGQTHTMSAVTLTFFPLPPAFEAALSAATLYAVSGAVEA